MDMIRKGPWTEEEDSKLRHFVAIHGEGHWSSLSLCAGLKRSGKSCRLRWLNYLKPDVRRGNITLQEQLLILQLNLRMGNRWSKIAKHLPGRTDNEIKNYWRTKVKKQAKQLKCDVSSQKFKDTLRYVWMPRLAEQIQLAASSSSSSSKATAAPPITTVDLSTNITTGDHPMTELSCGPVDPLISPDEVPPPAQDLVVWAESSCYDFVRNYGSYHNSNFQDGNFNGLESEAATNSTSNCCGLGEGQAIQDSNTLFSGEDSLEIFPQFDYLFWDLQQQLYCDEPTLY